MAADILKTVRTSLNKAFARNGLPECQSPRELYAHLASLVTDHEHFKSLLIEMEPEKRQRVYDAMRPHLRFTAKALEQYEAEAKSEAAAAQLPALVDGKLIAYEDYNPSAKSLTEIAEQAIRRAAEEKNAKFRLSLTCKACTFTEAIFGPKKMDAIVSARKAGWLYIPPQDGADEYELCPGCAAKRPRLSSHGHA